MIVNDLFRCFPADETPDVLMPLLFRNTEQMCLSVIGELWASRHQFILNSYSDMMIQPQYQFGVWSKVFLLSGYFIFDI